MNLLRRLLDHEYKELLRFTKIADAIDKLDEEMMHLDKGMEIVIWEPKKK